jgi:hypothetical protein
MITIPALSCPLFEYQICSLLSEQPSCYINHGGFIGSLNKKKFEGNALGLLHTAVSRATTLGDPDGLNSAIYFDGTDFKANRIINLTRKETGKNDEYEPAKKRNSYLGETSRPQCAYHNTNNQPSHVGLNQVSFMGNNNQWITKPKQLISPYQSIQNDKTKHKTSTISNTSTNNVQCQPHSFTCNTNVDNH